MVHCIQSASELENTLRRVQCLLQEAKQTEQRVATALVYIALYGVHRSVELLLSVLQDARTSTGSLILQVMATLFCRHDCAFTEGIRIPNSIKKSARADMDSVMEASDWKERNWMAVRSCTTHVFSGEGNAYHDAVLCLADRPRLTAGACGKPITQ
jgi:hypothetical protein